MKTTKLTTVFILAILSNLSTQAQNKKTHTNEPVHQIKHNYKNTLAYKKWQDITLQSANAFNLNKPKESIELSLQALDIAQANFGKTSIEAKTNLKNLGVAYSNIKDYQSAEKYLLNAIDLQKKLEPNQEIELASILYEIALVFYYQGDYDKAEMRFFDVLNIQKKHLAVDATEIADTLHDLGMNQFAQKKYVLAEKSLVRAIEIRKKRLPLNSENTVLSILNLGVIYIETQQHAKAETILESLINNNPVNKNYIILSHLANAYFYQKKFDEAEKTRVKISEIIDKSPSISNQEKITNLAWLGQIYFAKKMLDKAEKSYSDAFKLTLNNTTQTENTQLMNPVLKQGVRQLLGFYATTDKQKAQKFILQNGLNANDFF